MGCGNNQSTKTQENENDLPKVQFTKDEKSVGNIQEYYPLKENLRYVYTGEGMESASSSLYVDFIKDNKIQYRVINGGTTAAQVFEIKNGELKMLNSVEEFYYRDDLTGMESKSFDILLKEPLIKGNSWLASSGKKKYIQNTEVSVNVPFGTFAAIEVVMENGDNKTTDYYVKGIGIVKRIYKFKDSNVTVSLEKIIENVKVDQTVKFYYPDINNDKIVYKKVKLSFNTNEEVKDYFEKYFKENLIKGTSPLIVKNTKINKVYLNVKEQKVYIDFSKELLSDINLGSGGESLTLQAIGNTLGDYYNVDKVSITVDGKSYESGHIIIDEKNPIKVNLKNTTEIN